MATLTNQERNALRKVVRLLDMRENQGQAAYDAMVQRTLADVREMLTPTERYKLHLPEDYAFEAKVVWYETGNDGVRHLWLQIIEEGVTTPPDASEIASANTGGNGGQQP